MTPLIFHKKEPPHDQSSWVRCLIEIKDLSSGETRFSTSDLIEGDEKGIPSLYIYQDGNFSCDCNRGLFFGRSVGIEPDEETCCGDDRYSLNVYSIGGEIIYKEFEGIIK